MFFLGTTMAQNGQAYDNKSGQWLGSLVASSGANGTIMVTFWFWQLVISIRVDIFLNYCDFNNFQACAPRYIYYVYINKREPVGICYTGRLNSKKFKPYRPCVAKGKAFPRF